MVGYDAPVQRIDKPWGHEQIWARTDRYVGKLLCIRAGGALSLQFHRVKMETILVQSGKMWLEYEIAVADEIDAEPVPTRFELELTAGGAFHIPAGMIHRMTAIEDTVVIEVSTPELDDVVRIEDAYGRVGRPDPG